MDTMNQYIKESDADHLPMLKYKPDTEGHWGYKLIFIVILNVILVKSIGLNSST